MDGTLIQDTGKASPRVLSFTVHDLPIDLPKIEEFRQRGQKEREYVLPELLKIGWNKELPHDKRLQSLSNLNYRLVEVVMMLLLPLLAVALAVPPKRSTSSLGVFVSIVLVVAYHKVNEYGADVASLGMIHPFIALWGPFFLFAALIVWMYYRVAFVPGGKPSGARIGLCQGYPLPETLLAAAAATGSRESQTCGLISSPRARSRSISRGRSSPVSSRCW